MIIFRQRVCAAHAAKVKTFRGGWGQEGGGGGERRVERGRRGERKRQKARGAKEEKRGTKKMVSLKKGERERLVCALLHPFGRRRREEAIAKK